MNSHHLLIQESDNLAAMMFGEYESGGKKLKEVGKRISKVIGTEDFLVPDFLRQTFGAEENVKHFFNLDAGDIEMLINLLEWGKANPMEVVSRMNFGSSLCSTEPIDSPEILIGYFLTELALFRKRAADFNQLMMLVQEALFRCLPNSEIFIAFSCKEKQIIKGCAYVGKSHRMIAKDFYAPMSKPDSIIVQCLQTMLPIYWHSGTLPLGLPHKTFRREPFQHAYLAPIVVANRGICLCFAGRFKGDGFDERERIWIDQITDYFTAVLKSLKR